MENHTGSVPGHTGGVTHTVGRAGGSVTISAADLLAAARGSGLSAKPAAGPTDGTQTTQPALPVTSAKSPELSAPNPEHISAPERLSMTSLKAPDVALDSKIQPPLPTA